MIVPWRRGKLKSRKLAVETLVNVEKGTITETDCITNNRLGDLLRSIIYPKMTIAIIFVSKGQIKGLVKTEKSACYPLQNNGHSFCYLLLLYGYTSDNIHTFCS